ncbi:MAG: D-amino acid aminotransferase [Gemmatimonadaceae bacterium]
MLAYLNGQILPRAAATIPVEDRGFIFGDGVYEVWRVVNGQLFELDRHLARLVYGLSELRIAAPEFATRDGILTVAEKLLSGSGLETGEGTVYVQITRGSAPRTHAFPPEGTPPTVYATVNRFVPPEEARARGVSVVTVPDLRWMRCNIKTLQLLPNVLAKQEASERSSMEALLVRDGVVTEGSHTNCIGVIDGVLRTHPLTNLILPGVTRAVVLELARELGIPVSELAFNESEISDLDELFLAGTTSDVMPIVRVNDQTIGDGVPGPISLRLAAALRARIDSDCAAPPYLTSVSTTA